MPTPDAAVPPSDSAAVRTSYSPRYRPEIDGLRAAAITLVVLYHVQLSCPGGFVGVDVFFVISGYLITSLIWQSLERNEFSFASFWERRIRRLYPALTVMVLATLVAGSLLLYPRDLASLARSAVAQALLCANLFFWRRGGDYFAQQNDYPLLHTWSLALEEQFYLLFPFLLVFLFRRERLRRPAVLRSIMLGLFAISLLLAIATLPRSPIAAFYLLPTRAWELICGACLAILPSTRFSPGVHLREIASWLGLGGILLPAWHYSYIAAFPGLAALPPCLGTALILWANTRPEGGTAPPTSLGWLLAWRPVVFLGLISYSLYLWHWPAIVFYRLWSLSAEQLTLPAKLGVVAASLVLAILSWRLVEQPFRTRKFFARRRGVFVFAACSFGAVLLFAGWLAGPGGHLFFSSEVIRLNAAAQQDINSIRASQRDTTATARFNVIGAEGPPVVLLWGDSHASCAVPAVDTLCRKLGVSGRAITAAGTPPLVDSIYLRKRRVNGHIGSWSDAIIARIAAQHIPNIVLAARWSIYEQIDSAQLQSSLIATIRRFAAMGCRVWVLMDVPDARVSVPRALRRLALTGGVDDSWLPTEQEHRAKNAVLYRLSEMRLPATFLDPAPTLLDRATGRYRVEIDGVSLYADTNHLTRRGARLVLLPLLRANMVNALDLARKVR